MATTMAPKTTTDVDTRKERRSRLVWEALAILGMDESSFCCSYCGDTASEWDHFRPLVKDRKPTGYISEIHNLVPACGKCNQSKGNKEWKTWMLSAAALSRKQRAFQIWMTASLG